MNAVQTTIEIIEPDFSAGQCLTAAHLVRLRDYLATIGGALLESWSDGIIHGMQLEADSQNGLYLSAGAFKLKGRVGFLSKPLPIKVDFVETSTLMLMENGEHPETDVSCISSVPPKIETGKIRNYSLSWFRSVLPDTETDGMLLLGTVRYIAGQPFRNFSISFHNRHQMFPDILKGRPYLDAGEICRLFTPYACRGRWPTLGFDVQRELAAWLIKEKDMALVHLIPSLLRGDLPVCDYTGQSTLREAALDLCHIVSSRRSMVSDEYSKDTMRDCHSTRAPRMSNAMKVD